MAERAWIVLRTDDNGVTFMVSDGLEETAAAKLVNLLTARGHKQTYTTHSYSDRNERDELLTRLAVRI